MKRRLGIRCNLLAGSVVFGLSISFFPEITQATNSLSALPKIDARYAGTYVYAENPDHGRAIVLEATSKALDQLPATIRNLARRSLAQHDPLIHRIVIDLHNGLITVQVMGERSGSFTTHPGVNEKVTGLMGRQVELTQRFTKEGLEQVFVNPRGSSRILYMLRANGQQLLVSTTTTSVQLNVPVSYQLLYVRQ